MWCKRPAFFEKNGSVRDACVGTAALDVNDGSGGVWRNGRREEQRDGDEQSGHGAFNWGSTRCGDLGEDGSGFEECSICRKRPACLRMVLSF